MLVHENLFYDFTTEIIQMTVRHPMASIDSSQLIRAFKRFGKDFYL